MDEAIQQVRDSYDITGGERVTHHLGMQYDFVHKPSNLTSVSISNPKYIANLLESFDMSTCTPSDVPTALASTLANTRTPNVSLPSFMLVIGKQWGLSFG